MSSRLSRLVDQHHLLLIAVVTATAVVVPGIPFVLVQAVAVGWVSGRPAQADR